MTIHGQIPKVRYKIIMGTCRVVINSNWNDGRSLHRGYEFQLSLEKPIKEIFKGKKESP